MLGSSYALTTLGDGTISLSGNISGGRTGTLESLSRSSVGTGTTIISGTNSYTGKTVVNNGLMLFTKAAALPNYDGTGYVSVTNNAVGKTTTLGVRAGGTGEWLDSEIDALLSKATFTFASPGTVLPGFAIEVTGTNTFTYGTAITATGGDKGFKKLGAGTLILTGTNTYTGVTTISAGTLILGDGTTNGSVAGNIVMNNAALVFNNGSEQTYAGIISNVGTVTKTGAGTLTLSGKNIYGGDTTISAGKLALAAAGNIPDASAIKVANGATYEVSLASGTLLSDADVRSQLTGTGTEGLVAQLFSIAGVTANTTITMTWAAVTDTEELKLLASNKLTLAATDAMPLTGYLMSMKYNDDASCIVNSGGEAVLAAGGGIYVAEQSGTNWLNLGANFRSDLTTIAALQAAVAAGTLGLGDYGVDTAADIAWVATSGDASGTYAVVPEPGILALLAIGLIGLLAYAWRKRK